MTGHGPSRRSRFLDMYLPVALSFLAVLVMLISTTALSWVRVAVEFKDPVLGVSWFKGQFDFKVLENAALSAAIIVMLALSLVMPFLKRRWAWAGLLLSLGLLACFAYYLYSLIHRAYDALGFLDSLLALLKEVPLVGPRLAEMARKAVLDSIDSVRPQPGLFLYLAGNLMLIASGVLRLMRRPSPPPAMPADFSGERVGG